MLDCSVMLQSSRMLSGPGLYARYAKFRQRVGRLRPFLKINQASHQTRAAHPRRIVTFLKRIKTNYNKGFRLTRRACLRLCP
jgi:hypothetical protein